MVNVEHAILYADEVGKYCWSLSIIQVFQKEDMRVFELHWYFPLLFFERFVPLSFVADSSADEACRKAWQHRAVCNRRASWFLFGPSVLSCMAEPCLDLGLIGSAHCFVPSVQ